MVSKNKMLSLVFYNEACERFSMYGLRALLFLFLRTKFNVGYLMSMTIVHGFIAVCYTVPVFIGMLVESYLGKYRAIIGFALVYLFGALVLAIAALNDGSAKCLAAGLALIAVGMGGLKPCTSFFLTSTADLEMLPPNIYRVMYFVIYACSLLSNIWAPVLADFGCTDRDSCYFLPFAAASFILACSIMLMCKSTRYYDMERDPSPTYREIFHRCVRRTLQFLRKRSRPIEKRRRAAVPGGEPRGEPAPEYCNANVGFPLTDTGSWNVDRKLLLDCFVLFAPSAALWMLVDQQYTSWIEQGMRMRSSFIASLLEASDGIPVLNSLVMILFIPIVTSLIFLVLKIMQLELTNRKNTVYAVLLAAFSFFMAAAVEFQISRSPERISILWQVPQYTVIALAELVMAMGKFLTRYDEYTPLMRSMILLVWFMCVGLANLAVIAVSLVIAVAKKPTGGTMAVDFVVFGMLGLGAVYWLVQLLRKRASPGLK